MTNTQNKKFSELVQKSWFFWLSIGVVVLLTSAVWFGIHSMGKQSPVLNNNDFVEMTPWNWIREWMETWV